MSAQCLSVPLPPHRYVVAMVQDLLGRLVATGVFEGIHTFHMWCDTGPHVRAYEFLAY